MALPNNPRDQYLKTQVETASKEQLVVMLFDGIIRFTEVARKAIEAKKIEESHHALMRAQAIVMELICTVDKEKGGDVAKNLMGLHAYAFNCLITCNMKKDVAKIDEVQKIYRELREGWVGAMNSLGIGASKGAAAASAAPAAPSAAKPAARPAAPVPPKPTGPAPIPKAPPAAFAPKALPGKPAAPGNGGILAQGRPLAAPKPITLGAPKPIMPGAPVAPKAGMGLPVMPKPIAPGIPATPAPVPAPAAPAAALPQQPAAAPSAAAISYGMGRTAAMMGAYGKTAMPAPAQQPAAPAAQQPAAPAPSLIQPMLNAKQAAMLNAYQAKSRSIA